MRKKTWSLTLEDRPHTVELQHSSYSGSQSITVDGKKIEIPREQRAARWDTGSKHSFLIGGHEAVVAIRSSGFAFEYELFVDGKSIDTGLSLFTSDPTRVTPEAVRARRAGAVAICGVAGLAALGINVALVVNSGTYYPELAMIGPAALVLAAYYALNPDDPWEIPKPFPLRLGLAIFLAIAAGIANWYVTENGVYWMLFGPG
jgi:Fas apoptotic inhibitory molecule (FAIM1)